MHVNTIVASVLFKTQLLHDTRHFVQSSLALDYSFKVSFFSVYRPLVVWVIGVFSLREKGQSPKIVVLPHFLKKILENRVQKCCT